MAAILKNQHDVITPPCVDWFGWRRFGPRLNS